MEEARPKLSNLPAIDRLLVAVSGRPEFQDLPRQLTVKILRQAVHTVRHELQSGGHADVSVEGILNLASLAAAREKISSLRRVVNATGVPLHTNLGRAPLSERAAKSVVDIMTGYSTLEYNVETGERGSRYSHVVQHLCDLTGAENAMVVNNNAAAVLLTLSTLAAGREVIVSRGQLVEIGGSFRIPEVLRQSGARLVEVGTTNKTHLADYEAAITEQTAAILKVHTSNYRLIGFTSQPDDKELVSLAHSHGLTIIDDLGSGTLIPIETGCWREPSVLERIRSGYDVVTFSGDKLLGGGQAGIIAGRKPYIDRMKKNPLARAVRIDKLSLAALEGTLQDYLLGNPLTDVPVQRMLHRNTDDLANQAQYLAGKVQTAIGGGWRVRVLALHSTAGGGSLPAVELPGWGVSLQSDGYSAAKLERLLRRRPVPVICRIQDDEVILDVRTLSVGDMDEIVMALQGVAEGEGS